MSIVEEVEDAKREIRVLTECLKAAMVHEQYEGEVKFIGNMLVRACFRLSMLRNPLLSELASKAREYEMSNVVSINKSGFARCVSGEHEDKNPSMYCKGNFAYCFSCGFKGDVIKVYSKVHNLSWSKAVIEIINLMKRDEEIWQKLR
ncbi:MAG: CHC2 zinc finger domain-containing protein [Nitrososphaerota archaeon]